MFASYGEQAAGQGEQLCKAKNAREKTSIRNLRILRELFFESFSNAPYLLLPSSEDIEMPFTCLKFINCAIVLRRRSQVH